MGCAPSELSCNRDACRLMSTKLVFAKCQLDSLNSYFRKIAIHRKNDVLDERAIESTVERLVQRLIEGVGDLDRRFSSMFLVSLNETRRIKQLRFEYLLRLDTLSVPAVNAEFESIATVEEDTAMPGFLRLKVLEESWQEYVDIGGRLRRDLVKAKLAALLAMTIKQELPSQSDGRNCSTPGQVVEADVLDKILKQPDYSRVFYGSASSDGPLPEPRKHRIALIEDAGGILLRIGLECYKTREIEVRLLIGIGLSSWSNLADYPRRVPLHHCDALLHYTVAQSGMYAVAVGPYIGARCENRTTLWRVRVPAGEKIMNDHYADDSVPALTDSVLMEILYQLREGRPHNLPMKCKERRGSFSAHSTERLRVVSRHILRTIHQWALERVGPDPLTSWAPDTLSRHVLLALDELVRALRCQNLRCYFHPRCNVMLQCAKGGVLHHEDSYANDARVLESYLMALHQHSSTIKPNMPAPLDVMESELIVKWRGVMASLPRGSMGMDCEYSPKQLEYLNLVIQEVLAARDSLIQEHIDECSCLSYPDLSYNSSEQIESLVYLVRLVLYQARDQHCQTKDRKLQTYQRRKIFRKCAHYNTTSHFDHSVDLLIDILRRDTETANMDFDRASSPIMAKMLLHWLYFGMENDEKILEPILRPYLSNLFSGLHEYCYYADSWRNRQNTYIAEMRSLTEFCKLVLTQKLSPATGIVDYLSNGRHWAESLIRMIEHSGNTLTLIFLVNGRIMKYNLTFADNKSLGMFSTWSKARSIANLTRKRRSNSYHHRIQDRTDDVNGIPTHVELRNLSPLTYVASMSKAHLRQRGIGDLVSAMISLNKFSILQEVASILPREERLAMLDMIHRVARESARKRRLRKSGSFSDFPKETYTPRADSDLPDSSSLSHSGVQESCIIIERQKQLQRELQGMQDTWRTNAFPKLGTSTWDSHSLSSWTSSLDSSVGKITFKRYRVPIWDSITGGASWKDSPLTNTNLSRSKFGEMISREESPNWSTTGNRRRMEESLTKDEDRLPSWETLESALNEQLCSYRFPDKPKIHQTADESYLETVTDAK